MILSLVETFVEFCCCRGRIWSTLKSFGVILGGLCGLIWGRLEWSLGGHLWGLGWSLGGSALEPFLGSLPGAFWRGQKSMENQRKTHRVSEFWGVRLKGFRGVKNDTLKTQILDVFCVKIASKSCLRQRRPKTRFDQIL